MRILYFSRDYTTHDRRFLEKLVNAGHEIGFLRLEDDGITYESRPLPPGIHLLSWGSIPPADDTAGLLERMPEFEAIIQHFKPDLIHAGPVPTCGFMTSLSGFHPYAVMSWGSDILIDAEQNEVTEWAARFATQQADLFISDCDAVTASVRKWRNFSENAVIQFPWGTDLQRFSPGIGCTQIRNSLGWQTKKIVLSNRTWESIYGVEVAVEAFRIALEFRDDLRLILAGTGSLAPQIQNAIEKSGLRDFVNCPGMVPQAALPDYYRAADIYLSCAYSDGSSVSLLEALATGLPLVVTDAPGNREWVTPDINGWLASPGKPGAYAEGLTQAASLDNQARAAMALVNRRKAETRANWHENFERLLAAFDRIGAVNA